MELGVEEMLGDLEKAYLRLVYQLRAVRTRKEIRAAAKDLEWEVKEVLRRYATGPEG
jgi:hypothetical protein